MWYIFAAGVVSIVCPTVACVASVSLLFGSEEQDFRCFAFASIFARAKHRKSCSSLLKSTETFATQASPTLGLFSSQFANKVKWIKSVFISFPGVAASFASVAYRIALSNFLSASLGAVRFLFFDGGPGSLARKSAGAKFLWFGVHVCMCYCDTGYPGLLYIAHGSLDPF